NSGVSTSTVTVFIKHGALGNETVTGTVVSGVITFTYTATPEFACKTSIVAYGVPGNNADNYYIDQLSTPPGNGGQGAGFGFVDKDGNHVDTCGTVTPADDLTVSKTATPGFKRTYHWTIDKSANKTTVYSKGGGESGAVHFTVAVTKDAGTDS